MKFSVRTLLSLAALLIAPVFAAGQDLAEPPLHSWAAPAFWSPAQLRVPKRASDSSANLPLGERAVSSAAPAAFAFVSVDPCRQYDSRSTSPLPQATPRTVTLTGSPCNLPAGIAAVSMNVSVFNIVGATGNGVVTIGAPGGSTISWLNYPPAQHQIDNAGIVPVDSSGDISIEVLQGGGSVDFVLDVNGYYASTGIVNSVNGLFNDVTLAAGMDLGLNQTGQTITLFANSTSAASPDTLVRRDSLGNFAAGTITGNLTGAASANVLKTGDSMTGTLTLISGDLNLGTDPSAPSGGSILKNGNLFIHDAGGNNVFVGIGAGSYAVGGSDNAAIGTNALHSDTVGSLNFAGGSGALLNNATGNANTAAGVNALANNVFGSGNVAAGYSALFANFTGNNNVAIGSSAGGTSNMGDNNIAIGNQAGSQISGTSNIAIANIGAAGENNTIRIGTVGTQTNTYIAGINGAAVAGSPVVVDGQGHLGVAPSSQRFKQDILDMGETSEGILKLRPVSFRYTPDLDPLGVEQYGLIAEEVAEVLPDLVACDNDGNVATVRYQLLLPMLLNEVQRDRRTIDTQRRKLQAQQSQLEEVTQRLERLESLLPSPVN